MRAFRDHRQYLPDRANALGKSYCHRCHVNARFLPQPGGSPVCDAQRSSIAHRLSLQNRQHQHSLSPHRYPPTLTHQSASRTCTCRVFVLHRVCINTASSGITHPICFSCVCERQGRASKAASQSSEQVLSERVAQSSATTCSSSEQQAAHRDVIRHLLANDPSSTASSRQTHGDT